TLTAFSNGAFTYTPVANYTGTDSFTYLANDGTVDSAAAATVSLTVNSITPPNLPPVIAAPSSAAVQQNQATWISGVSISDSDAVSANETITVVLGDIN